MRRCTASSARRARRSRRETPSSKTPGRNELVSELDATRAEFEVLRALHPTKIDGAIACVIFAHLEDPKDRVALAAVSKVFRDAEQSDASLPGSTEALRELGDKFCKDHYMKASYWFRKAADRGDADAMFKMGSFYAVECGVMTDLSTACEWWERASGCGQLNATFELADCCEAGVGVERNGAKALELYLKGAELGCKTCPMRLGRIYEHGDCGVAVNKTEALKWYRVSVERGDDYAELWVVRLEAELAAA